jgi:hypothetical protein
MELFHPLLHDFALLRREVGIEHRRLICEPIPVISDHAAIAEARLERTGGGAGLLPAAIGVGWRCAGFLRLVPRGFKAVLA